MLPLGSCFVLFLKGKSLGGVFKNQEREVVFIRFFVFGKGIGLKEGYFWNEPFLQD